MLLSGSLWGRLCGGVKSLIEPWVGRRGCEGRWASRGFQGLMGGRESHRRRGSKRLILGSQYLVFLAVDNQVNIPVGVEKIQPSA